MRLDGLSLKYQSLWIFRARPLLERMRTRIEACREERTRIAQELHDTLLQDFPCIYIQLHRTVDQLPPNSPVRLKLSRAVESMRHVMQDVRRAVRGLRVSDK